MPYDPKTPPKQMPPTRTGKPAIKPPVSGGGTKKPNPIGIYPPPPQKTTRPPIPAKSPANDVKPMRSPGVKASPLVGATKLPPRKGMR